MLVSVPLEQLSERNRGCIDYEAGVSVEARTHLNLVIFEWLV